jgi:phage baseplate assembly protein W
LQSLYYKIPLDLEGIIQKRKHRLCGLKESIAQNLHLIISTYRGESAFSDDFGCSLWDEEFNLQFDLQWKENLYDSLRFAVEKFEKRLKLNALRASMEEHTESLGKDKMRVRRRLKIEISGIIGKTNESFNFSDTIFISPLAQK